jgi:hypothetical protein
VAAVTVYVVVTVGLATGLAIFVALNPADGVQLYVVPPVAVIVVEEPAQIATLLPALAVGVAITVM